MRVLHLPTATAGNSWGLSQGEKALGLKSEVMYSISNWMDYPSDINLQLERYPNIVKLPLLVGAFISIRNQYDVYHFNFGSSLIHAPNQGIFHAELPFYPRSKSLFVTYNGCDIRQKFPTMKRRKIASCHEADCYNGMCNSGKKDENRRKGVEKIAKYVKHIWAVNPDLLYFLPAEKSSFLPYTVPAYDNLRHKPDFSKKQLTIVHAPTNRAAKGSGYILKALEEVRQAHPDKIKIQLIEGVPHAQAMAMYREADLVIDQLLSGWYGGTAIEVMNMGKPVICRIEEADLHFLPKEMAKDVTDAFIQAEPADIKEEIMRCIEDREFLERKSEAGLEYARKWHNPLYVAGITKAKYEENSYTT